VRLAERLCLATGGKALIPGAVDLSLTISVGVAGVEPAQPGGARMPAVELLARADFAMYHAKQGGKNAVAEWCEPNAPEPDPESWLRRTGANPRARLAPKEQ
jgi:PleD family two-component response regulator